MALSPLAIALPAGAAPAASPPVISLFGGDATFHVGGHTWQMSIFAFSGTAEINLSGTHEFDSWSFVSVPKSDFKASARTGTASFDAHNALAPVAFANLKFFPSSRHKASCHSGSETFFGGKVTGSVTLVANHKGLKFKSVHVVFRNSTLDVDRGCIGSAGATPCFPGFWGTTANTSVSGEMPGLPGERVYSVTIFKGVNLRAPRHSSVTYEVTGTEKKPVFNSKLRKLSVAASGVVKGSAVLKAAAPPTVTTSRCTIGRQHFKARDASYFGSYKSPAGFSARSLVAGVLKVGRSGPAFFDIITFKKA